jgi:(1->4)-alpha-D-glucan 1-alpha-D-glucosylmutase
VSRARVPSSTYRLQFHAGFTFRDAAALAPYLAALGVGACYASPYLKATPGTLHGYDICDHNALNPDLGDDADYQAFVAALREHSLGQVLDFVPNHMGTDARTNAWWHDVLENGPSAEHAAYFDIDWTPVTPGMRDKLLLPILGDQYGWELERGHLQLAFESGALQLRYFDHMLPINPQQAPSVYRHHLDGLRAAMGDDNGDLQEFLSVLSALQNLPAHTERLPERIAERKREKDVTRKRLLQLVATSAPIAAHIEAAVRHFNGTPGDAASFDALHELLENQAYRLSFWRTALDEINYRRFFDINDLAALRMEEARVFRDTHGLLAKLIADGAVTGVRVDHPDGLYDPAGYFARLQGLADEALVAKEQVDSPSASTDGLPLYVLAEKILSATESLPAWPMHGTTGYDFLNLLNGVFIDPDGLWRLRRHYQRFTGRQETFEDEVRDGKRLIMDTTLSSELNVLAHTLYDLAGLDRRTRDFTLGTLTHALQEVAAALPVYRTYIDARGASDADRTALAVAFDHADRRNPAAERATFEFLRGVLDAAANHARNVAEGDDRERAIADHQLTFTMRFQQFTGPVQAKGVEDTAFYRHNVLLSLNEVGGDPAAAVTTPDVFHRTNIDRRERWPFSMTTTATHDTKRGEDARARLNVLSEIADEWARTVSRLARMNAALRSPVDGDPAPDRNDEYLFYQALLSAWPSELLSAPIPARAPDGLSARMAAFVTKATREAKLHTSWIAPDDAYGDALTTFVERTLDGPHAARFLPAFVPIARRVARAGAVNSLAQIAVKFMAPGVPDVYQGNELWDLHLVDPDNRQPVDFDVRRTALASLQGSLDLAGQPSSASAVPVLVAELLEAWPDGRIKLWLTARALGVRRRDPELFLRGGYVPLELDGSRSGRALAFARVFERRALLTIVPRLTVPFVSADRGWPLAEAVWQETVLHIGPEVAAGRLRNLITGEVHDVHRVDGTGIVALADILRTCPVAILGVETV